MVAALPTECDPRLVVGFDLADDAGVVRLPDGSGLVQTVDFFTPIVDDPRTFGAIAAANALSDVYAMGGRPLCAMNLVCFPSPKLPVWVLEEILAGGSEVLREAGTMLVGGHSVRDDELKYGLSVSGLVDLDRLWTNAGARPGDALILTKAIGTGVLATARKRDAIDEDAMAEAKASMRRLNKTAAEVGAGFEVHACTDITGNGLAGHAWEMARASGARLRFDWSSVPLLAGARDAAVAGHVPGGTASNRRYVGALELDGLDAASQALALDPQTSGGLLFALPAEQAAACLAELRGRGLPAARVGDVEAGPAAVVFAPGPA